MLNQETAKAARTDSGYILRAPRRMRVADAVAQYMRVPMGAGNSVPWDPLVAPYVIEPMNCLASREYDAVIFVGPARTGKTIGLIDGWVIYNVICDPADMLIIQMTEEKAREHSKKRLARTFRVSPEVVSRLSPNKNDNNVYDRTFLAGNYLKIGWPSVNIMSSSDYKCVALTDYDRFAALQEKVSRAKRLPWTASSSQVEYDQQRLNDLQEKKRQKDLQDAKEQAERNYQEQQKRRNAENAALNRMNETEAARHQREIARINSMQYADQAVRDAAIQRENERYEKALASGKKKTRETRNDEATRLLLQYSQQQAQVEGQIAAARQSAGIATEKMTEAHKQLLALQQRISDLDGKKLTADEKSVLARKDELIQALTLLDVKQQELQKQTALNDLKKKTIQLTSQLAEEERAQRQQHDLDIATVGMGDQQRQRYQVQLSLRQKYQQQLEQLRRDSEQKGTYNTDDYRKAEQALTESLNRQLNENRRYWQQLEVVQGNWKNGVLRAFQDFTVDADNTAGTAEQVFSSAFSNMGNGLATFVTTGKLNFKSFTSSVLSDMAKILAQATMMKSIKGIGSVSGAYRYRKKRPSWITGRTLTATRAARRMVSRRQQCSI